jgi:hypothetical protein
VKQKDWTVEEDGRRRRFSVAPSGEPDKQVGQTGVSEIRTWSAHERISVRRAVPDT